MMGSVEPMFFPLHSHKSTLLPMGMPWGSSRSIPCHGPLRLPLPVPFVIFGQYPLHDAPSAWWKTYNILR